LQEDFTEQEHIQQSTEMFLSPISRMKIIEEQRTIEASKRTVGRSTVKKTRLGSKSIKRDSVQINNAPHVTNFNNNDLK
jgi:hypothetical protein